MFSFLGGIIGNVISKVLGFFAIVFVGEKIEQGKQIAGERDTLERERDELAKGQPKSSKDLGENF